MHDRWDALVMDLDGTLLCGAGQVSPANLAALDAVRNAGVEVVVATGRCYRECTHILKEIGHEGVVIAAGGSLLCDDGGQTLCRHILKESLVREIAVHVLQGGHRLLLLKDAADCGADYVLVGDAPLHAASSWWFDTFDVSVIEARTIDDDPWPKCTIRAGAVADEEHLATAAGVIKETVGRRARLQHWSAVTSSEATGSATHLLEIFESSVNKWSMLERHLGASLDPGRIVAIGDGLNDIELLQEAGLSIAMANADDHVMAHADVVGGHHNEHGFASAIGEWVLGVENGDATS